MNDRKSKTGSPFDSEHTPYAQGERSRPLEVRTVSGSLLVFDTASGSCLAGVGANYYRPWLFPLYTPRGQVVLREFPFDHPFHNGCFVAQHPVRAGARTANFWAAPPPREANDEIFVDVGRIACDPDMRVEPVAEGVRVIQKCIWRDANDSPILDEARTLEFTLAGDAAVCDVTSRKVAAYGNLEFPATKYGGIGVRLDPRLLPAAGGCVLADGERRGGASVVHDTPSRFVAYESAGSRPRRFGLCLIGRDSALRWFVRDYGLALLNPTQYEGLALAAGEAWTTTLRLVAYDGALDATRVERWGRGG